MLRMPAGPNDSRVRDTSRDDAGGCWMILYGDMLNNEHHPDN